MSSASLRTQRHEAHREFRLASSCVTSVTLCFTNSMTEGISWNFS